MENKLSLGIDELDLDVRTFTALKRAGVNTIADIEAQAEQLAETIPARQWKHITDALNTYKGIPMPGSLVEENILGAELTFDEIAEMVGEIIILDRSTESRNWYKAVKVEDVFVSNDDHRHLRYYDGAKQRGIIDEMYFSKSQRSPQRAWRVKSQDKPAELPTVQPERAAEVAEKFNYAVLTAELGDYLRHKEEQLRNEYMNFTANCGRIFAEAQEKLSGSNQYNGLFEKWFTAMGFAKTTVYRMIDIYKFRSSQIGTSEQAQLFDSLSKTLQADISAPSAPPELVEQVMNGNITTHKEYIELKKQLDEAQEKAAFLNKANTATNEENQKLRAERVNAMNRADNAERELSEAQAEIEKLNREADEADREYDAMADRECHYETEICKLEQRIKELENKPVDVAVQTDDSLLKEKDQEISELKEQIERMSDKTVKSFVIRMSPDEYEQLIKALEQADDRLKSIIKNARILKI